MATKKKSTKKPAQVQETKKSEPVEVDSDLYTNSEDVLIFTCKKMTGFLSVLMAIDERSDSIPAEELAQIFMCLYGWSRTIQVELEKVFEVEVAAA